MAVEIDFEPLRVSEKLRVMEPSMNPYLLYAGA